MNNLFKILIAGLLLGSMSLYSSEENHSIDLFSPKKAGDFCFEDIAGNSIVEKMNTLNKFFPTAIISATIDGSPTKHRISIDFDELDPGGKRFEGGYCKYVSWLKNQE